MQKRTSRCRAFTLVELLIVVSIGVGLMSLAVPAINSISKQGQLDSASRVVMNLLSVARTEAISQRTLTRFVICTGWQDCPDADFRKVSVWKSVPGGTWTQITKWEEMPEGVVFDPQFTALNGSKATNYVFDVSNLNSFSTTLGGKTVEMKYAEFLPTGGARMSAAPGPELSLTLRPGYIVPGATPTVRTTASSNAGKSVNWAMITASTLTGRLKVSRP